MGLILVVSCVSNMILVLDRYSKKDKTSVQFSEAKSKTSEEHAEVEPSSETLNMAKVKVRDALT